MKATAKRYLVASVWVYFTLLFGWLGIYLLTGDRFGLISLVNLLAVYYFAPLPLVFVAAWLTRRRELWIGALLGMAAFAWFWGAAVCSAACPSPRRGARPLISQGDDLQRAGAAVLYFGGDREYPH